MSTGGGKVPQAPDPSMIIGLENKYNRYNTQNPFGDSHWTTDANGHETLVQTPNSDMQGAIDRAFKLSATPSEKEYVPQGMDQLASAIMGRVGARYGLGSASPNNLTLGYGTNGSGSGASTMGAGGALNTNLKQQYQAPGAPTQQTMSGAGPMTGNANFSAPQQMRVGP